jgi:hypothetical protein
LYGGYYKRPPVKKEDENFNSGCVEREKKNGYAPPSLAIPDMAVWNETIEYMYNVQHQRGKK